MIVNMCKKKLIKKKGEKKILNVFNKEDDIK